MPGTILVIGDDISHADLPDAQTATVGVAPNPFNPRATISITLATDAHGQLAVFDTPGRRIAGLWEGAAPSVRCAWDGCDDQGRSQPSGVYTFVLTTDDGRRVETHGTLLR